MGMTTVEQLEHIFEVMDLVLNNEVLAECDRGLMGFFILWSWVFIAP